MAGRLPRRQQQSTEMVPQQAVGDGLMNWLASDDIQKRIRDVASKALDPVRFLRLARVVAYKTPKLQQCSKDTILQSVVECAARGWELGFDAHLVPYKNKGRMECQLIADYRGLKKSVMRGGKVTKMKAGVVFEGEEFTWEEGGLEEHFEYKPNADVTGKEKMLFAWARAWFNDGTSQFCVVRRFEVMRAKAASRGSDSEYSPWQKFPDRMWAKTALRRLCNEIGLEDEAMAVMRDDDSRSFHFGADDDQTTPETVTVVENRKAIPRPDAEDRADEAERQAASQEGADIEGREGELPGTAPANTAPPEEKKLCRWCNKGRLRGDDEIHAGCAKEEKAHLAKQAQEAEKEQAREDARQAAENARAKAEAAKANAAAGSDQEPSSGAVTHDPAEDSQDDPGGQEEPGEAASGANGNGTSALVTLFKQRGEKYGITPAALLAACESVEDKSLASFEEVQEATLQRLVGLMETEQGAYTVEEHAFARINAQQ